MDALRTCAALLVALAVSWASAADAASHRTRFFLATAPTLELATQVAEAAERYRSELAIEWLGHELPDWQDICPITVTPKGGAGGETRFEFDRGRPGKWRMIVQGSPERILDSVVPHEVLHMVFATHFGQGLPRWADEGACTTVEHSSERALQERLLYQCLTTDRGIPFNKMFAMREYPKDMLPLYAQGYSVTRFLIAVEGKPKFVNFVGEGLKTNNWTAAVKRHYGFVSLSQLQTHWLEWVRQGGREEVAAQFFARPSESLVASAAAVESFDAQPDPRFVAAAAAAAPPEGVVAVSDAKPIESLDGVTAPIVEPAANSNRLVPVPTPNELVAASQAGQTLGPKFPAAPLPSVPETAPTNPASMNSMAGSIASSQASNVGGAANVGGASPGVGMLASGTTSSWYAQQRDAYRTANGRPTPPGTARLQPGQATARPQPIQQAGVIILQR